MVDVCFRYVHHDVRHTCSLQYRAGLHTPQSSPVSPAASDVPSPHPGVFSSSDVGGADGRVCDAWVEFILLCQCYGPHQEGVASAHVHVHEKFTYRVYLAKLIMYIYLPPAISKLSHVQCMLFYIG